jgi:hypothetical protein
MKVPLDSLDKLEQYLIDCQAAYENAPDHAARQALRSELIRAKTRARFAAKKAKSEQKRAQKAEMALWILTWLENPPVFSAWVRLRRTSEPLQE